MLRGVMGWSALKWVVFVELWRVVTFILTNACPQRASRSLWHVGGAACRDANSSDPTNPNFARSKPLCFLVVATLNWLTTQLAHLFTTMSTKQTKSTRVGSASGDNVSAPPEEPSEFQSYGVGNSVAAKRSPGECPPPSHHTSAPQPTETYHSGQ
jgi:hypothetical protein